MTTKGMKKMRVRARGPRNRGVDGGPAIAQYAGDPGNICAAGAE